MSSTVECPVQVWHSPARPSPARASQVLAQAGRLCSMHPYLRQAPLFAPGTPPLRAVPCRAVPCRCVRSLVEVRV